jgi:uncharacterized protein YigE (DUF2233 family)
LGQSTPTPAIRVQETGFAGEDGKRVAVTYVRVNPRSASIALLYLPGLLKSNAPNDVVALKDLLGSDVYRGKGERYRVLLSGGFSSYRLDVPLGLLVVDGTVKSRLNESVGKADPDCGDQLNTPTFRWPGVFCERTQTREWSIIPAAEYESGTCRQAVQAGPLLVEPGGKVGICSTEPKRRPVPYRRSAVCIDRTGGLNLVFTEATHLFPLATWLARADQGGLNCEVALNLAGDSSAGLLFEGPKEQKAVGDGSPVVSALLVKSP